MNIKVQGTGVNAKYRHRSLTGKKQKGRERARKRQITQKTDKYEKIGREAWSGFY